MVAALLRRGMLAGLLAGLLSGLFALAFGVTTIDQAIELEQVASVHSGVGDGGGEEELFSRAEQKVGLFFATGLFGVTSGGVFGLAYAYFRERLGAATEWGRSLTFAAAGFLAVFLLPFLKYPANPPTVGDSATIGARTAAYFALIGISLALVVLGWVISRRLRERGVSAPVRQMIVVAGFAALFTVVFLALPASVDPGEFPAGLLWEFRLSSVGTQVVFWAGLGVVFGLLGERAARKRERAVV